MICNAKNMIKLICVQNKLKYISNCGFEHNFDKNNGRIAVPAPDAKRNTLPIAFVTQI